MIPKIAHFHWTGSPLPWLRSLGVESFRRMNPDWEVHVHDTPADIREFGLPYAQEADWTWNQMIARHGGFQVATDMVFVRPVPAAWLDCEINVPVDDNGRIFHNAMMGAVPEHPFFVKMDALSRGMAPDRPAGYQDFGVNLLSRFPFEPGTPGLFRQPRAAVYHFDSFSPPNLWGTGVMDIPDDTIGVHWYGGHPVSVEKEPLAGPGQDSWITRLAEVMVA